MKFFSYQFPNIKIKINNKEIKFKEGTYCTDDKREQEALIGLGFPYISNMPEKPKARSIVHEIPKRWTKSQIIKYAKEHNIEIPKDITTKKDLKEYIESL